MATNLAKKHSETNSFRILSGKDAIERALKPKPVIKVEHAVLYQDNARVNYTINGYQRKNCKILLEDLTAHVLEAHGSTSASDVTVYYFIEENIQAVCQSYLSAGKEMIAL